MTGATLTVTGVGVGSTKVVVTATDADGLSVGQSLKVTVTEAPPEPITIDDVKTAYPTLEITPTAESKSEDIELPAGYTLNSLNEAIVAVARKTATTSVAGSVKWAAATANAANVWVVTAVSAGITNVDVLDSSEILAHSIRVTVTAAPPPDPIPPTVTETLPDVWLGINARTSETFDLVNHFQHSSAITYSATSGDETIATATIEGSMLTVTSADTGRTRVVVTATAEGKSVQDGFQVEVGHTNPYHMGEIGDRELTVGGVEDVDVGDNFSDPDGQDLRVHAVSKDEDFATVTVDGLTVTVTAEGVGTTEIAVYVEDEDGLMSGRLYFSVTVSESEPVEPDPTGPDPTAPEPMESASGLPVDIEIPGKGKFYEGTITNEGHRVISENTQIVKVLRTTGMMVKLEGVKRGDTKVYVVDAENEVVGDPSNVTVNNSPPMRDTEVDPDPLYTMLAINDAATADVDESTTVYVVYNDGTTANDIVDEIPALVSFFKDDDLGVGGDKLEFDASTDSNYVKASVNSAGEIEVDVVKKDGVFFIVTITAKDDTGELADAPVMLAVRAMAALPKSYDLKQKPSGVLGTITVDNRQDVEHTIVVEDSDNALGFVFAHLFAQSYIGGAAEVGKVIDTDPR